tara:strand:+ start:77 stop:862 length:786 start_codon:yes stop_codon:yes gene_type:complete
MGFKQRSIFSNKGLSRRSSSPLNNTNSKTGEFSITSDQTTTSGGNTVRTQEREKTITNKADRNVETQASSEQAFLDSFAPEFAKAESEGFTGTLLEYIEQKEQKLGFADSEEKIKQKRVRSDLNEPVENVEIITKEVARPFFDYPGRGEVDFKEKNWHKTPAGKEAVQYFGQIGKQLKNTLLQMNPYSKRKALNELNMYGNENMTKVIVDMHNNDPKKLEEIIRKYQPGNIGEGSMETIEEKVVTQGQNSSQQDTGWQNID